MGHLAVKCTTLKEKTTRLVIIKSIFIYREKEREAADFTTNARSHSLFGSSSLKSQTEIYFILGLLQPHHFTPASYLLTLYKQKLAGF